MQAYALICAGVRIACYNQLGKGPRQCVLIANGGATKDRISTVFDPQFLAQMEPVSGECDAFQVDGYISKVCVPLLS